MEKNRQTFEYDQHVNKIPSQRESPPQISIQQGNENVNFDFMTKNTSFFSRLLGLHYMRILKTYRKGINDYNLIRYQSSYEKTIKNQYMWSRFLQQKERFSLLKEIFKAERGPFIFIVIISIFMGVVSLFGAYLQRFLFYEHTEEGYHTSGWVFFAVIIAATIIRFFTFNYLQTLANQVAINVRIHLQNSYIRCIMNLPKNKSINKKSLLYFNYFASIEVIMLALMTLPYFISSIVIVFGIIGFVIHIVGWIGIILLGTTLFSFAMELLLMYYMFHIHEHYGKVSDKRNSLSIFSTTFLIKLIKNGLSSKYLQKVFNFRRKQTNLDFKYTLSDGFIQIFAEGSALFTVFMFYVIESIYGFPSYKQIFECVVLFSVFKTPVKIMAYGLAFMMELYGSTCNLQEMFSVCKTTEQTKKGMKLYRHYPQYSKLWERDWPSKTNERKFSEIDLFKNHTIQKYKGQLVMLVGKIDSNPTCESYLKQMIEGLPTDLTYDLILDDQFILNVSIKQNILFGAKYNEERFVKITEVVGISEFLLSIPQRQLTEIDSNYFQAYFPQFMFQVQVARALYNEVDCLMIYSSAFQKIKGFLQRLRAYLKEQGKIAFIINTNGNQLQVSDTIIVLNKDGSRLEGPYKDLIKTSSTLRQLQNKASKSYHEIAHIPNPRSLKQRNTIIPSEYEESVRVTYKNIFKFYNYNHFGAGVVLLILLCIPPLIDLYMQIIVAESKDFFSSEGHETDEQIHNVEQRITLRFGVALALFFFFSILKIIFLSTYLRNSAYRIFKNLINTFVGSKIQPTLSTYNKQNGLDLQRNLESIDIRTTTEFDIGMTGIFQYISIIVFASISSVMFLVVGIPFIIIVIIIFVIMVKYSRKIFNARRPTRSRLNDFVKKLISNRQSLVGYHKNSRIFQKYTEINRKDIIYELNQSWLLEALSILLQFIIILMLMVVLIVSLTWFDFFHSSHQAFLELSISFLIGLVNGGRLNLKLFKSIDRQVVGISSLFQMIEHYDHHQHHVLKNLPTCQIDSIEFKDFSLQFENYILTDFNIKIIPGDRITLKGNNNSGKRVVILALYRLFSMEHMCGQVLINNIDIYEERVSRQFLEKLIHAIPNRINVYFGPTVISYIQNLYPEETAQNVSLNLQKLWKIIDVQQLFQLDTKMQDLQPALLDVFFLLVALSAKPQVLILQNSFSHIDSISLNRIIRWLVKDSGINIIINLIERSQVTQLFDRNLRFEAGKLVGENNSNSSTV